MHHAKAERGDHCIANVDVGSKLSLANLKRWFAHPNIKLLGSLNFDYVILVVDRAAWEEPIFRILRNNGNIIMAGLNGLATIFLNRKPVLWICVREGSVAVVVACCCCCSCFLLLYFILPVVAVVVVYVACCCCCCCCCSNLAVGSKWSNVAY